MTDREALAAIARLGLEEGDYDYEPMIAALPIALAQLDWVLWKCASRFTLCRCTAVGPESDLLRMGWLVRDGRERCPAHANTMDPTSWTADLHPQGWVQRTALDPS